MTTMAYLTIRMLTPRITITMVSTMQRTMMTMETELTTKRKLMTAIQIQTSTTTTTTVLEIT